MKTVKSFFSLFLFFNIAFTFSLSAQHTCESYGGNHRHGQLQSANVKLPFTNKVQSVQVEILDGYVIIEGDIILGRQSDLMSRRSAAVNNRHWANAIIPYTIQSGHPKKSSIEQAIQHVNSKTNLTLKPRTTENDYVEFIVSGGCASFVGRIGGKQSIFIGNCSFGSIVHEICHAAGFYHEQSRQDRDNYVTINWGNITPGRENNFHKYAAGNGTDLGAYDYGSIMHYPKWGFSNNGQNTIDIKMPPGTPSTVIGQRSGLSDSDISGINTIYPVPATPTASPKLVNTLRTVRKNSKYGPGDIPLVCTNNMIIDGSASQNEDSYFIAFGEIDLMTWDKSPAIYSDWVCTNCQVPNRINLNNFLNGHTWKNGKTYWFKLAVGPKWDQKELLFIPTNCSKTPAPIFRPVKKPAQKRTRWSRNTKSFE